MQFRSKGLLVSNRQAEIDGSQFEIFTQVVEMPDAKAMVHEYWLAADKGKDEAVSQLIAELKGAMMTEVTCTGVMSQVNGSSMYKCSLRTVATGSPRPKSQAA